MAMTDTQAADLTSALDQIREREKAAIRGPWKVEYEREHCDCPPGCDCPPYPGRLRLGEPWLLSDSRGNPYPVTDRNYLYAEVCEPPSATAEFIAASRSDVPRLLAAVGKVLERHQPGVHVVAGSLCKQHAEHRCFSITEPEAQDVRDCPDCNASVWRHCTGCGSGVPFPCSEYQAIAAALTGQETADGRD